MALGRNCLTAFGCALAEELFLPCERMRGYRRKIVELRRPLQRGANALRLGDHGHDIARAARRLIDSEVAARYAAHRLDDFQDRVSVPVAARHKSAATAAADPPDDPPGVNNRSSTRHGFTALP